MRIPLLVKLLALLILGGFTWIFIQHPMNPERWGYLTGKIVISILLSYGAARLTFRFSKPSNTLASIVFLLVMLLLILASALSLKNGSFTKKEELILKEFITSVRMESVSIGQNYDKAVRAAGAETFLDPDRLFKDKDFKESEVIIAKLKELYGQLKKEITNHYDSLEIKINALPIGEKNKTDLLKGFNSRRITAENQYYKDFFMHEGFILENSEHIMKLLKDNPNTYKLENGTFAFYDDEVLNKYNELIMKNQESAKALEALAAKNLKEGENAVRSFQELFKR